MPSGSFTDELLCHVPRPAMCCLLWSWCPSVQSLHASLCLVGHHLVRIALLMDLEMVWFGGFTCCWNSWSWLRYSKKMKRCDCATAIRAVGAKWTWRGCWYSKRPAVPSLLHSLHLSFIIHHSISATRYLSSRTSTECILLSIRTCW